MLFRKSMTHLSDEDLMIRACGGNDRAYEEIYHRYSRPLLRYFFRMLWQDKNKAEDFLHDLFVRILEKSNHFDTSRRFSTWIYSIAHNMCKNEYRKQAFRSSVVIPGRESTGSETLSEVLDQDSFQKSLEALLHAEGEDARTIFILRHEHELSFVEIAEIIRCPEGTVRSRHFYLKKKLAAALEEYKGILEK